MPPASLLCPIQCHSLEFHLLKPSPALHTVDHTSLVDAYFPWPHASSGSLCSHSLPCLTHPGMSALSGICADTFRPSSNLRTSDLFIQQLTCHLPFGFRTGISNSNGNPDVLNATFSSCHFLHIDKWQMHFSSCLGPKARCHP